jgi:hypothetical protein
MAQPASGLIRFTNANSDYIDIPLPVFPYSTTLDLPFEFIKLSNGKYEIFDSGEGSQTYDRRMCECTFELSATDQQTLNNFIRTDGTSYGRSQELTLEMANDSGFFPFAPDKSNIGPFDVGIEIVRIRGIGELPFKHFVSTLRISKGNDSWPSYILPTEVNEGGLTIETITNCRSPQNWFIPSKKYVYDLRTTEGRVLKFMDRSSNADWYETGAEFQMNESKTAAIFNRIVSVIRNNTFSFVAPADNYPFGRDLGNGTFNVKLGQNRIIATHTGYNRFNFGLIFSYESTP